MSCFVGDDGKEYDIFGRGRAEFLAQEMSIPFLGSLPIHMDLRANSDSGNPVANWEDNEHLGAALDRLARNLAAQISVIAMTGKLEQPRLSIR